MTPAEQFAAVLSQPRAYLLVHPETAAALFQACGDGVGYLAEAVRLATRQVPVYTCSMLDDDSTLYAIDPDGMVASPPGLDDWDLKSAGHVGQA